MDDDLDDAGDLDQPLDFSNVLEDDGGFDDFGGQMEEEEEEDDGNRAVVDFLGGGDGGDDEMGAEEEGDEEEDEEEGEEEEDDSDDEEELELTVDEEGRIVFDGGEMDYAVRSFPHAFDWTAAGGPSGVLRSVLEDCVRVRSAKAQGSEGEYSEGITYFLRANEEPGTRLEGIARSVFDFHTQHAVFDASRSGAEWWVQVLQGQDDDIGLHFDKDYDLEESALNIHPHLATVTYLTDRGGPTMILPVPGPLQHGQDLSASFRTAVLSLPETGKHTSFDGRFLHAAPAELRLLWQQRTKEGEERNPDDDGGAGGEGGKGRVTLLVNVWLNHLPNSAGRPGKRLLSQLAPNDPPVRCTLPTTRMTEQQRASLVVQGGRGTAKGSGGGGGKGTTAAACEGAIAGVEVRATACKTVQWTFRGEAKQRYTVSVPVPLDGSLPLRSEGASSSTVQLLFGEGEGLRGGVMREGKRKRDDGDEEEEEDESDEEEEDEFGEESEDDSSSEEEQEEEEQEQEEDDDDEDESDEEEDDDDEE